MLTTHFLTLFSLLISSISSISVSLDTTNGPFPIDETEYILQPENGIGDRKFLSTTSDGRTVDLWYSEDGSGRQVWKFNSLDNVLSGWTLKISRGLDTNRNLLSTFSDGTKCDLFDIDDGSGRQRWVFVYLGHNGNYPVFAVLTKDSSIREQNGRRYLSTVSDGSRVDLWTDRDSSGRQHWVLRPFGSPEWQPSIKEHRNFFVFIIGCNNELLNTFPDCFRSAASQRNVDSSDFTAYYWFYSACRIMGRNCKLTSDYRMYSVNNLINGQNGKVWNVYIGSNLYTGSLRDVTINEGNEIHILYEEA